MRGCHRKFTHSPTKSQKSGINVGIRDYHSDSQKGGGSGIKVMAHRHRGSQKRKGVSNFG